MKIFSNINVSFSCALAAIASCASVADVEQNNSSADSVVCREMGENGIYQWSPVQEDIGFEDYVEAHSLKVSSGGPYNLPLCPEGHSSNRIGLRHECCDQRMMICEQEEQSWDYSVTATDFITGMNLDNLRRIDVVSTKSTVDIGFVASYRLANSDEWIPLEIGLEGQAATRFQSLSPIVEIVDGVTQLSFDARTYASVATNRGADTEHCPDHVLLDTKTNPIEIADSKGEMEILITPTAAGIKDGAVFIKTLAEANGKEVSYEYAIAIGDIEPAK